MRHRVTVGTSVPARGREGTTPGPARSLGALFLQRGKAGTKGYGTV